MQADTPDNARHFLFGTGGTVLISRAQPRTQQLLAAEDIQREVAVMPVIAVEETPFLMSMQRIIRRIHIQNDLRRCRIMGLQKKINQQLIHRLRMRHNLLVAARRSGIPWCQLQAVQRALARQGTALVLITASTPACRISHIAKQRQQRILAQGVVIIEVFITQRQTHHALLDQRLDMMFNLIRIPMILKTPGQTLQNMAALFNFPQQQSTTVRTDLATVKFTHHHTASQPVKFQLTCSTLCLHKAVFLPRLN